MNGRLAFLISFAGLVVFSSGAKAEIFLFNVVPAQSNATVTIDLSTPIGNGSDSDTSQLNGFLIGETDIADGPFGSLHVFDLSLATAQATSLSICVFEFITCQAGVDVDAAAGDIIVDMISAGPPSTVVANAFTQVDNVVAVTGMVVVDATGLANGQIPEGDFLLDGAAAGDFSGTIVDNGPTVQLNIQIDATSTQVDPDTGVAIDTTVDASIVAIGTPLPRGDMDCSGTVDLNDLPHFVAALLDDPAFAGCSVSQADVNADSLIDGADAQAFINAL